LYDQHLSNIIFSIKHTDKVKDSPAQVEIHNTVLELYLSNDMNFPSISQTSNKGDFNLEAAGMSRAESSGKFAANRKDSAKEKDSLERRDKGLRWLKIKCMAI
jgi:hypothetical protein